MTKQRETSVQTGTENGILYISLALAQANYGAGVKFDTNREEWGLRFLIPAYAQNKNQTYSQDGNPLLSLAKKEK